MRFLLWRRAVAVVAILAPLLAACDYSATDNPSGSTFSAAERAELMEYLPEPQGRRSQPIGRRSQPGFEAAPPLGVQAPSAESRALDCPVELSETAALREPCHGPPRNYALRFGPGRSQFISTFAVIQDQTFRVALDIRPDHLSGTQHLLWSAPGLRFSVLPNGSLHVQTPGYVGGDVGMWSLTSMPGAVRAHQWQRVEVSYNELLLRIAVDGQVKASTSIYQESGPATIGPVTFAPSFSGAIDHPRFSTYDGSEVYETATFDEGQGLWARFTGFSGRYHRLTRADWVLRISDDL